MKISKEEKKIELKRELGLFSAVNFILAVMIGSGIFISPTSALKYSGSIGFCLIIWILCGIISLLGALAFAELSTVVPSSGGEYAYFIHAFGPLHNNFGQLPAFICAWVNVMILRPAEVAAIILTFAEYIIQPFYIFHYNMCDKDNIDHVKKLIAIVALGLITYINCISVKLFVKIQNVFVMCKVAACMLVIGGGVWWLASGHTELLSNPFNNTTTSPGNIALAFYSGLWAYDGWTMAASITEEINKPEVNILRSILIAVPIIAALYVSMNLMYMSVLTISQMISSSAVAVVWADNILPTWLGFAIPLGVAISTFGCALSLQFSVSRLCYVAGREGHIPRVLSFVHIKKMTPAAAVIFQGILTFGYMLVGNIITLIEFSSFLTWVFYGLAMLALIIMRKTKPNANRPYKVPIIIPWFVLFIALFLAVTPIVYDPSLKYLFTLLFVLVGVAFYHLVMQQKTNNYIGAKFTYIMQVLCMVVAPENENEN